MSAETMLATMRKQLDAFASKDWKTYRSTFTDDGVYDEEATQRRVQGPDRIIQVVEGWTRAFPDLKGTIKSSFASGDSMVLELEWEGTLKGPLEGPFGPVSPTGLHGRLPAVQVVRFDGELISELRHYFDLLTILIQAGVMPQGRGPQPNP